MRLISIFEIFFWMHTHTHVLGIDKKQRIDIVFFFSFFGSLQCDGFTSRRVTHHHENRTNYNSDPLSTPLSSNPTNSVLRFRFLTRVRTGTIIRVCFFISVRKSDAVIVTSLHSKYIYIYTIIAMNSQKLNETFFEWRVSLETVRDNIRWKFPVSIHDRFIVTKLRRNRFRRVNRAFLSFFVPFLAIRELAFIPTLNKMVEKIEKNHLSTMPTMSVIIGITVLHV